MARKAAYVASAIGAACLVAPVLAQDLPPPNLASEQAVMKWARDSKIADRTTNPAAAWDLLGALDDGLLSWSVLSPKDSAGIAKVGVRLERFRPNNNIRSEASLFEVDCNKQLVKTTLEAGYAEHNFGGAKQERPGNGAWAPIASNEIVSAVKEDACKAGAGAGAVSTAAGPSTAEEAAAWARTNNIRVDNVGGRREQWRLLNYTTEGPLYAVVVDRNEDQRSAKMIIRLERYNPASSPKIGAVKSQSETYEIQCRNSRLRKIGTSGYSDYNLSGREDGQAQMENWVDFKDSPLVGPQAAGFCRDFTVQREFKLKS
jgi:ribosomal protein S16